MIRRRLPVFCPQCQSQIECSRAGGGHHEAEAKDLGHLGGRRIFRRFMVAVISAARNKRLRAAAYPCIANRAGCDCFVAHQFQQ